MGYKLMYNPNVDYPLIIGLKSLYTASLNQPIENLKNHSTQSFYANKKDNVLIKVCLPV